MRADRRYLVVSAQQIDPLSWFTGPLVPLAFATVTAVYGGIVAGAGWAQTAVPILQALALVMCVGADVLIHALTRPLRPPISGGLAAIALALSAGGMVVSAIGYAGSDFTVELWWASGAFALTIASLGPYLPVRQLLPLGAGFTVAAAMFTLAVLQPIGDRWGIIGTGIIASYPAVAGLAATVTFSYMVVSKMMPMLESPSRIMVTGQEVRDEAADRVERVTLARLTARAAPFLEQLADAGTVAPADRALAGQLARRLRDELVTQSNLSWLDSIAEGSRLVVVDPDRLARRMNTAQRTTLRALLRAVLDMPATDSRSLMVDLRKGAGGSIAVGVSLDMALPEGTRVMHLAPYYLTLKTAVRDLTVSPDRLGLTFTVAPEPDASRDRGGVAG